MIRDMIEQKTNSKPMEIEKRVEMRRRRRERKKEERRERQQIYVVRVNDLSVGLIIRHNLGDHLFINTMYYLN